jgi:uncharacterized protein (DUF952 family)
VTASGARWLYHVVLRDDWERARAADSYDPRGVTGEAFIHASYRDAVLESARLYFPVSRARVILRIDPRKLTARVEEAATPRGPMPHVFGPIPRDAVAAVYEEETFAACWEGEPNALDG